MSTATPAPKRAPRARVRPALRPGLRVLVRDEHRLQVGTQTPVLLPRTEEVRRTLAALEGADLPVDAEVLAGLVEQGLVVDANAVFSPGPLAPAARASLPGPDLDEALSARTESRVLPLTWGPDLGAREALTAQGLTVVDDPSRATLGLVIGTGEPDRSVLDPLVRDDVPHLVVRLSEGAAVVGPFVSPGRTACLRCLDAHRAVDDPAWPLLLAQLVTGRPRPDGMPEPVDPALATLAVSWAARDLASYVDGRRPATWSTTVHLPADLAATETTSWLRHPDCGCSWDLPLTGAEILAV